MINEWCIIFKGRVQGVGFRWTVVDAAEKQGLVGTVKNLKNGDVEAIVQASEEDLKELLATIQSERGSARIDSYNITSKTPSDSLIGFRIITS